jgi:molybdopterin-guanine dinucleotide biosynthesis protein A
MLSVMQQSRESGFSFAPAIRLYSVLLVERLVMQRGESPVVWVHDGERDHPQLH